MGTITLIIYLIYYMVIDFRITMRDAFPAERLEIGVLQRVVSIGLP